MPRSKYRKLRFRGKPNSFEATFEQRLPAAIPRKKRSAHGRCHEFGPVVGVCRRAAAKSASDQKGNHVPDDRAERLGPGKVSSGERGRIRGGRTDGWNESGGSPQGQ